MIRTICGLASVIWAIFREWLNHVEKCPYVFTPENIRPSCSECRRCWEQPPTEKESK